MRTGGTGGLCLVVCLAAFCGLQAGLAAVALAGTKTLAELCEESEECLDEMMCIKTDGPGGLCDPKCGFGESCVDYKCGPAQSHCTVECLSDADCAAVFWVCHGVVASLLGDSKIFQLCWPPLSPDDPTAGNPPYQFCGADDPLGYCNSGICLTNLSGKDRCTSFCEQDDNCPEGWHCDTQTLETGAGQKLDTTVCKPGPRPSKELVESLGQACAGPEDCPEEGLCVDSEFGPVCSFVCANDDACGCLDSICPEGEYQCIGFAPIAGGYMACTPLQDPDPRQPGDDVGSPPGAEGSAPDAGPLQTDVGPEEDGGFSGDGSGLILPHDPGLPCSEDGDCPQGYVCVTTTSAEKFCAETVGGGGNGGGCGGCVVAPRRGSPLTASSSWALLLLAAALLLRALRQPGWTAPSHGERGRGSDLWGH